MSFILFRPNKELTKPVTHTERYQEDNMIFTRKKLLRAGGEPKHGVIFHNIPSIIEKFGDRKYVMNFKIFWATSFRIEGGSKNDVRRKEKYLGRFGAEYSPKVFDLIRELERYWKLEEELLEAKLNNSTGTTKMAIEIVDTVPRDLHRNFDCQKLIWNIMEAIKNPDIDTKGLSVESVRVKLIEYLLTTEARFSMVTNNL